MKKVFCDACGEPAVTRTEEFHRWESGALRVDVRVDFTGVITGKPSGYPDLCSNCRKLAVTACLQESR